MIDTNIIEKEYDKRQSVQLRGGGGGGGQSRGLIKGVRGARCCGRRICLAIIKEGETRVMERKEGSKEPRVSY